MELPNDTTGAVEGRARTADVLVVRFGIISVEFVVREQKAKRKLMLVHPNRFDDLDDYEFEGE